MAKGYKRFVDILMELRCEPTSTDNAREAINWVTSSGECIAKLVNRKYFGDHKIATLLPHLNTDVVPQIQEYIACKKLVRSNIRNDVDGFLRLCNELIFGFFPCDNFMQSEWASIVCRTDWGNHVGLIKGTGAPGDSDLTPKAQDHIAHAVDVTSKCADELMHTQVSLIIKVIGLWKSVVPFILKADHDIEATVLDQFNASTRAGEELEELVRITKSIHEKKNNIRFDDSALLDGNPSHFRIPIPQVHLALLSVSFPHQLPPLPPPPLSS